MNKDTQEKLSVNVKENNIFYRIKRFFINLFSKNKSIEDVSDVNNNEEREEQQNSFRESIKNIETEETKLLELQRQYRRGEIKEEELTQEQVDALCALYDKQIESLRKAIDIRKQKLLEYQSKSKVKN